MMERVTPTENNREPLRAGDIIQYSSPFFVAGTTGSRRITQVLAVQANGNGDPNGDADEFVLSLANNELITKETRIKRIREFIPETNKLYEHAGVYRPIDRFQLIPGTLQGVEMDAMKRKVEELQAVIIKGKREQEKLFRNALKEGDAAKEEDDDSESDCTSSDSEMNLLEKTNSTRRKKRRRRQQHAASLDEDNHPRIMEIRRSKSVSSSFQNNKRSKKQSTTSNTATPSGDHPKTPKDRAATNKKQQVHNNNNNLLLGSENEIANDSESDDDLLSIDPLQYKTPAESKTKLETALGRSHWKHSNKGRSSNSNAHKTVSSVRASFNLVGTLQTNEECEKAAEGITKGKGDRDKAQIEEADSEEEEQKKQASRKIDHALGPRPQRANKNNIDLDVSSSDEESTDEEEESVNVRGKRHSATKKRSPEKPSEPNNGKNQSPSSQPSDVFEFNENSQANFGGTPLPNGMRKTPIRVLDSAKQKRSNRKNFNKEMSSSSTSRKRTPKSMSSLNCDGAPKEVAGPTWLSPKRLPPPSLQKNSPAAAASLDSPCSSMSREDTSEASDVIESRNPHKEDVVVDMTSSAGTNDCSDSGLSDTEQARRQSTSEDCRVIGSSRNEQLGFEMAIPGSKKRSRSITKTRKSTLVASRTRDQSSLAGGSSLLEGDEEKSAEQKTDMEHRLVESKLSNKGRYHASQSTIDDDDDGSELDNAVSLKAAIPRETNSPPSKIADLLGKAKPKNGVDEDDSSSVVDKHAKSGCNSRNESTQKRTDCSKKRRQSSGKDNGWLDAKREKNLPSPDAANHGIDSSTAQSEPSLATRIQKSSSSCSKKNKTKKKRKRLHDEKKSNDKAEKRKRNDPSDEFSPPSRQRTCSNTSQKKCLSTTSRKHVNLYSNTAHKNSEDLSKKDADKDNTNDDHEHRIDTDRGTAGRRMMQFGASNSQDEVESITTADSHTQEASQKSVIEIDSDSDCSFVQLVQKEQSSATDDKKIKLGSGSSMVAKKTSASDTSSNEKRVGSIENVDEGDVIIGKTSSSRAIHPSGTTSGVSKKTKVKNRASLLSRGGRPRLDFAKLSRKGCRP